MKLTPEMKRKPKNKKQIVDPDAEALAGVILAIMEAMGRGGLTWMANRLGMTPTAMRKRLLNPSTAFDAVTMRAILLVSDAKFTNQKFAPSDLLEIEIEEVGPILVYLQNTDQGISPYWENRNGSEPARAEH